MKGGGGGGGGGGRGMLLLKMSRCTSDIVERGLRATSSDKQACPFAKCS